MTSSTKKIEPRRLKGFRDYMPDLMEARSSFQGMIRKQAKLAGFREIGTPVLEYAETLLGQGAKRRISKFIGLRIMAAERLLCVSISRFHLRVL